MGLAATCFVDLLAMVVRRAVGGCAVSLVVDDARYGGGLLPGGTQYVAAFVVAGTQYRSLACTSANDPATRTAMAPKVAALEIC
jgi:hypothetical protein